MEHATIHVEELIAEKTCLQHDNSQLKVDLYEMQARFVSLEGAYALQFGDSSYSSIEKLKLEKGALLKELEELESSAQRQVDSWQSAAAVAKTEAHHLSSCLDKLVHENQLLMLSLENKVP